uniref:Uncharacterized protein n=1 Tax=Timema douglasi TaxID=61478 RepID=A0A7R8VNF9_TIMDO|nr:unnamed protein product [Timema douglasi]
MAAYVSKKVCCVVNATSLESHHFIHEPACSSRPLAAGWLPERDVYFIPHSHEPVALGEFHLVPLSPPTAREESHAREKTTEGGSAHVVVTSSTWAILEASSSSMGDRPSPLSVSPSPLSPSFFLLSSPLSMYMSVRLVAIYWDVLLVLSLIAPLIWKSRQQSAVSCQSAPKKPWGYCNCSRQNSISIFAPVRPTRSFRGLIVLLNETSAFLVNRHREDSSNGDSSLRMPQPSLGVAQIARPHALLPGTVKVRPEDLSRCSTQAPSTGECDIKRKYQMAETTLFRRQEVSQKCESGKQTLIIIHNSVFNVTEFLNELTLKQFVKVQSGYMVGQESYVMLTVSGDRLSNDLSNQESNRGLVLSLGSCHWEKQVLVRCLTTHGQDNL